MFTGIIRSSDMARRVLEPGMIVYTGSDYLEVLALEDHYVDCIDAIYVDEQQDFHTVGGAYYRTYQDFVKNEVI